MTRKQIFVAAIYPIVAIWMALFAVAYALGADWPNAVRTTRLGGGELDWKSVVLAILVISVFMMKGRIALINRRPSTRWLAFSFSYLNISICLFLLIISFVGLWPEWRASHLPLLRNLFDMFTLNVALAACWFMWQFTGSVVEAQNALDARKERCDCECHCNT